MPKRIVNTGKTERKLNPQEIAKALGGELVPGANMGTYLTRRIEIAKCRAKVVEVAKAWRAASRRLHFACDMHEHTVATDETRNCEADMRNAIDALAAVEGEKS